MKELLEKLPMQKKTKHLERMCGELKNRGIRITSRRRLILEIILECECTCSKEILYHARQKDPGMGIATVYRTLKILEDAGWIDRRNLYRTVSGESDEEPGKICAGCTLVMKDETFVSLTLQEFEKALTVVLRQKGYQGICEIEKIII